MFTNILMVEFWAHIPIDLRFYLFNNFFSYSIAKLGVIYCTQTAVNLMSREKGGNGGIIVNVSSVCGLDSVFAQPIYNATKHGIVGFTRSLGVSIIYR